MANPTVANVSLDRTSYAPGAPARLKFDVADADNDTSEVQITVTDSTGASGTGTITLTKTDALTVTVTDPDRTWTKDNVASSGLHFEYTSTA